MVRKDTASLYRVWRPVVAPDAFHRDSILKQSHITRVSKYAYRVLLESMQKVDQACCAHVLRYGVVKEVSIVIAHTVAMLHL